MAIVANKAGPGVLDRPYNSPNRTNAGTPMGTLTPAYAGELVDDTVNGVLWQALGTANNSWVKVTAA